MPKLELVCETCGKKFQRYPGNMKTSKHHFCCKHCANIHKKKTVGLNHPLTRNIIVQCASCGADLVRKPHYIKKHCFCNESCYKLWRSTRTGENSFHWKGGNKFITCKNCGKEFDVYQSRIAVFCSMKCIGEWSHKHKSGPNSGLYKRITVKCEQCECEMLVIPSRVVGKQHVFCSSSCFWEWSSIHNTGDNNPAWRGGGTRYYGPNWKEQKQSARERDGGRCRLCGIDQSVLLRKLDVHHIVRFMDFGLARYQEANSLDNLISLCPLCHAKVEGLVNV